MTITVQLGSWAGIGDFFIVPQLNNHSVILGGDFMRRHRMVIDYAEGNEEIRIPINHNPTSICSATNTISVPPRLLIHIVTDITHIAVDRTVTFDHTKQGFLLAHSQDKVRKGGKTLVRVINTSAQTIRINKG